MSTAPSTTSLAVGLSTGERAGNPAQAIQWLTEATRGAGLDDDERIYVRQGFLTMGDGGRLAGQIAILIEKCRAAERAQATLTARREAAASQLGDTAVTTIRDQVRTEIAGRVRAELEAEYAAKESRLRADLHNERAKLTEAWATITTALAPVS